MLEIYKNYSYLAYCEYLQEKYGTPKKPYYFKSKNGEWRKSPGITRTKDGLYIHHIYEFKYDMICDLDYTLLKHPEEAMTIAQQPENLVYCNLLEHYLLHLFIEKDGYRPFGSSGGIFIFIGPELNDVYSGFASTLTWKENTFNVIRNMKNEYISLVNAFIKDSNLSPEMFKKSFNAKYGWDENKNRKLYDEFKRLPD